MPLTIRFKKEKTWKIDMVVYGIPPDQIQKSADENNDPESSYDMNKETSLGGKIVRVSFEPNYTLVVIRVVDEDQLAFLPSREVLEKDGFETSSLKPGRVAEASGHPHKTNKFKTLATGLDLK